MDAFPVYPDPVVAWVQEKKLKRKTNDLMQLERNSHKPLVDWNQHR